jgi:hypothetical protein
VTSSSCQIGSYLPHRLLRLVPVGPHCGTNLRIPLARSANVSRANTLMFPQALSADPLQFHVAAIGWPVPLQRLVRRLYRSRTRRGCPEVETAL